MSGVGSLGNGGGIAGGAGQIRDHLAALKDGRIQGEEARLQAATRLLEGSFYQELFKAMRDTVPEGGALSGGSAEAMFTSMLDQHVSDAAALRSNRGIGQALYRHFVRAMGTEATPTADAPATAADPEV